jgi:predicted nucleic-acid-binding Zn-ribbon protein
MMGQLEDKLAGAFVCPKCLHSGGHVEHLAMSGTGLSRLLEIQTYRYAFVSCKNCGFTEIFNLKILAGQDNLGNILEIIFAD